MSSQPFDAALSSQRKVEDSRGYLEGLTRGLRGVKVEAGAGQAVAQWAEASLGLTTTSRDVQAYTCGLGGIRGVQVQSNCMP